eukprot:Em0001g3564a
MVSGCVGGVPWDGEDGEGGVSEEDAAPPLSSLTPHHCHSSTRAQKRSEASRKLCSVLNTYIIRAVLGSWVEDYREMRRARVWFEHGGSKSEGEKGKDWCWPEGEDHLSLLPREVALKIFMCAGVLALCRCAQVCRSWKDLTEEPQLWNKVDFYSLSYRVTDRVMLSLFQKYRPLLGHLNLRASNALSPESLKYIGQCHNLQDLNLSECQNLTDTVMENIARGCSGLLYLNLSFTNVTNSTIRILTKYCANLHYCSLAYCTGFNSKGLHPITTGNGCRKLVYLDLSGCTQLDSEATHSLGKGCPILNTLLLNDIPELSDSMILSLAAHCHTLRHISFMGGTTLSDHTFKRLAMANKKLKTIKIENNPCISDATLKYLSVCKDLQHIYLAGCIRLSEHGLKFLGTLKKLQVLNLSDCSRVSDTGIRYLLEGSQLKELNLTNCIKISDVTLLRMTQCNQKLTYINLCYCEHISDAGVDLLAHLPSLVSLDITGCNVSDMGVASLKNNPHFLHLVVAEVTEVTDNGLQKMLSTLDQLESLDISDCEAVTDTGLQSVAYHCHMLRILLMANLPKVTDNSIKYVTQGCTYLSQIDISGCNVTDKSVQSLRKGCTYLKKVGATCCANITREAVLKLQKTCEVTYNTDRPKYLVQDMESFPAES